ncbi:MAG: GbsR/MarR family transcriptional regulator [Paracoccaceae bacterium]
MPDTLADLCANAAAELGFSRPAGQIFGTVHAAATPPTADDLCAALGLSRSNVSTALKELRQAGLVRTTRLTGDRKEYFTAPADPWEIALRLIAQRRRRLIDPLLDGLRRLDDAGDDAAAALVPVVGELSGLADALLRLDPAALARLAAAGLPTGTRKKDKKRKKKT